MQVNGTAVGISFILRIIALILFVLAIFTTGHWDDYVAGGLAVWVGSTLVP